MEVSIHDKVENKPRITGANADDPRGLWDRYADEPSGWILISAREFRCSAVVGRPYGCKLERDWVKISIPGMATLSEAPCRWDPKDPDGGRNGWDTDEVASAV